VSCPIARGDAPAPDELQRKPPQQSCGHGAGYATYQKRLPHGLQAGLEPLPAGVEAETPRVDSQQGCSHTVGRVIHRNARQRVYEEGGPIDRRKIDPASDGDKPGRQRMHGQGNERNG
jgi:hypothetical protein